MTAAAEGKNLASHPDVASNLALLEIWLQARMAYSGVPGVAVAVVHDQELIYSRGFGHADVAAGREATADTIFRIASHSKLFTAIAVMQLRDQGKVRLDAPLSDYLPWFTPGDDFPESPPVTLRQILTHTSGLPREAGSGYWIDFEFPTTNDVIERMPDLGQRLPSETKWKYSNLALTLAGEVVTVVSGQSFETYVQTHILEPLAMRSTSVVFPADQEERLATGYGRRMPDLIRETLPFVDARGMAAATGVSSTVNDMARFVSWQLRLRDSDDSELLKGSTLREMQRPQWVQPDWKSGWGLGFGIEHLADRDLIGHSGGYPGYVTRTLISPKEKIGVVVFTNALDGEPFMISERIFEWLAPAIKSAVKGEKAAEADPAWAVFEGTYRERWSDMHVLFLDGKLQMVYPAEPNPKENAYTLEPDGGRSFILQGEGGGPIAEPVLFELGPDGRAARVRLGDNWMERVTY